MVSGFSVQVSEFRGQRTEDRKQRSDMATETMIPILADGRPRIRFFFLTPDTRHLTPKIRPNFSNYLRDTTIEPNPKRPDEPPPINGNGRRGLLGSAN
jgi:hypothetical protein